MIQKTLDALSHYEWRRAIHIMRETKQSIGTVYYHLHRLEREGFIESRPAELTKDELRARGGRGATEYRLTKSGIEERLRYHFGRRAALIRGIFAEE